MVSDVCIHEANENIEKLIRRSNNQNELLKELIRLKRIEVTQKNLK